MLRRATNLTVAQRLRVFSEAVERHQATVLWLQPAAPAAILAAGGGVAIPEARVVQVTGPPSEIEALLA